jgi:hypothetical protein
MKIVFEGISTRRRIEPGHMLDCRGKIGDHPDRNQR